MKIHIISVILCLLVVLSVLPTYNVGSTEVQLYPHRDDVILSGDIYDQDNLTVETTETLVVAPSAKVHMLEGSSIEVLGHLVIQQGAQITSNGTWTGIKVSGSSASVDISGAVINNAKDGIIISGGSAVISNTTISNISNNGLTAMYHANVSISDSIIDWANVGVYAELSTIEINNITVSNCAAGISTLQSNLKVTGLWIDNCTLGIDMSRSSAILNTVSIINSYEAGNLTQSQITFNEVIIKDNNMGLTVDVPISQKEFHMAGNRLFSIRQKITLILDVSDQWGIKDSYNLTVKFSDNTSVYKDTDILGHIHMTLYVIVFNGSGISAGKLPLTLIASDDNGGTSKPIIINRSVKLNITIVKQKLSNDDWGLTTNDTGPQTRERSLILTLAFLATAIILLLVFMVIMIKKK